jgi:NADPH:quinone reductase-like Zn-dependent oxidoreductase
VYGAIGGPAEGQIVQALWTGFGKCVRIQFFSMHGYEQDVEGRKRILDVAFELITSGQVLMPIAARFSFVQAREAHRLLESGTTCGRILLVP